MANSNEVALLRKLFLPGGGGEAFNSSTWEADHYEIQASMVYSASRTVRATRRETLSRKIKKNPNQTQTKPVN